MQNKRSISFQIIITVIISFAVLFIFFSVLNTELYYRNVTAIMQESQQHSITQLNESFDVFYQQLIYTLIQLSGDSTLKQYLTKVPEDNFEYYQMQRYVHDFLQTYIGFFPFHAADEGTYGYKVYIGGRWGKRTAHGQALDRIFTSEEEVLSVLEKAILLFREQGNTGERFADTVSRIGFEKVQEQLLGDEILSRKEEIVGASLHLKGGATC